MVEMWLTVVLAVLAVVLVAHLLPRLAAQEQVVKEIMVEITDLGAQHKTLVAVVAALVQQGQAALVMESLVVQEEQERHLTA
jgi:hypothetical protein